MTSQRCQNFFGDDANNLINIGKLIILDIALNNADRFPITHVWHSATGNAQNFICMIDQDRKEWENVEQVKFDTIVAIDNYTIPVIQKNNDANFNEYWRQIDKFIAHILTKASDLNAGKTANLIPSLNKFINLETPDNYVVKPKEEFRIIQGILLGIVMLANEGAFAVDTAM